ncbi:MAG: response regulator [Spirochaetales bacterium]|nr:response regulator [Spirochaetales bacterium]
MAKKKIEKNIFDAIILDLKIPKFDGYQLLKYLNENKVNLRILIITSRMQIYYEDIKNSHREIEENKLLNLADTILIKPFKLIELIKKLSI